ncbi:MAG TPA: hypothetical protein VM008_22605 [Phycisphaerae bacterium]|nr:hypothetical protein [Phycisphaerae bacterium]
MQFTAAQFLSISVLASAAMVARGENYSVTLVDIGPAQAPAVAMGINASGQVTGFSAGPLMQAFVFRNGLGTSLGTLGGTLSLGYGINNAGAVAGYVWTSGGVDQGFVYSGGETTATASSDGDISLSAINGSGEGAGVRYSPDGINGQAIIFSDGSIQYIGTLPGAAGSFANGINDLGQVVGHADFAPGYDHRAFLYANGVLTDLGTLGGPISSATAINNAGQIAGFASTAAYAHRSPDGTGVGAPPIHAFLDSNDIMIDLGTLGGDDSEAYALNNLGQVVGYSEIIPGKYDQHAFLYFDGTMVDLNTLIDPASGWVLEEATGINNVGQITGNGTLNGQPQAFLLTPTSSGSSAIIPTPEPATLILLTLSAPLLLKRRR